MNNFTAKLSFSVRSSQADTDIRLLVTVDGYPIYDGNPGLDAENIVHQFDDSTEQQHVLCFELQGKTAAHTQLSDTGEIIRDTVIMVDELAFDDISLGHRFTEIANYYHDTNGTTKLLSNQFYGVMGCNGRVEMRFSTPIYLWLLENM